MVIFGNLSVMANNPADTKASKTIVQIATSNNDFSILVEALVKADLVNALNNKGAFTVFAPTNQAFTNLFKTLGVNGISDLTKEQLIPILLYHVVDGKVLASDVKTGTVPTLNEKSSLEIIKSMKGVMINNNSNVVTTDIEATNGVIHVIDAVLMPATPEKTASKKKSSCN
jgi:transforming growth factor-beta-induced protein